MSVLAWLDSPERRRRIGLLAREILKSQGGRCGECGLPLALKDATKQSHSFVIICRACHKKTSPDAIIVIDDIDG